MRLSEDRTDKAARRSESDGPAEMHQALNTAGSLWRVVIRLALISAGDRSIAMTFRANGVTGAKNLQFAGVASENEPRARVIPSLLFFHMEDLHRLLYPVFIPAGLWCQKRGNGLPGLVDIGKSKYIHHLDFLFA
jgi:hypothetical protein